MEELEALELSINWHAQKIEMLRPSRRRNPAVSSAFDAGRNCPQRPETPIERITLKSLRRKGVNHRGHPVRSVSSSEYFYGNTGTLPAIYTQIIHSAKPPQSVATIFPTPKK
jgi:hypothetical protein